METSKHQNETSEIMFHSAQVFAHFPVVLGPGMRGQGVSSLFVGEEFSEIGNIFSRRKVHFERERSDQNWRGNCSSLPVTAN